MTESKTPDQIAADAKAAAEADAKAKEAAAQEAAEKANAALSKKVDHLKGCPAQRPESYEVNDREGKPVKMVRCIDCGQAKAL